VSEAYTPTTDEVRQAAVNHMGGLDGPEPFDRWLAQHEREHEALRAGVEALAAEGESWGQGVAVDLSRRLRALLAEAGEVPNA
jgi:hypothetical protein